MNNLLSGMKEATNKTLTENGAVARETTNSEVLDFFSQGGALRGKEDRAVKLFANAYYEDADLALKAMFYFRDVRGGQGQREAFRKQLVYLAKLNAKVLQPLLILVPEFGRWDDLYALIDTELKYDVLKIFENQLNKDIILKNNNKSISLLAKWLKSENTSSIESRRLAKITRKYLGLKSKDYRKTLSSLRNHIDVVERKTSKNKWDEIEYSKVPSNAMMKYRKAFYKHDEERIKQFVEDAKSGKTKINSSVLYPHEIVGKILGFGNHIEPELAEVMWKGLPNYVDPEIAENAIAVVDTSGSMNGMPKDVAVSLGIYLAERANGPYKDHFITFSSNPKLQKVVGNDITEKAGNLNQAEWSMSTNIEMVFMLILDTAIKKNISQDEMLDKVYIISDMEFDRCMGGGNSGWGHSTPVVKLDKTLMNNIKDMFTSHGYEMPQIVFWNVNARNKQYPMSMDDRGFLNVSGFSPSIFKNLIGGENLTPTDLMLEVLNAERYKDIHS